MFAILLCDGDKSRYKFIIPLTNLITAILSILLLFLLIGNFAYLQLNITSKKAPSDRYTFNFVTPDSVADMYNFFCGLWILSTLLAWKNVIGMRDKCIFVQSVQLKDWELISNEIQKRWNSKLRHTELNVLLCIWAKNRKWFIMQTQYLFRIQSRWWTI